MDMLEVCCGRYMYAFWHINISEMPKYSSAATITRVWHIVLHYIACKTIIKHNINGQKRINITVYIFESLFGPLRV